MFLQLGGRSWHILKVASPIFSEISRVLHIGEMRLRYLYFFISIIFR